MGKLETPSKPLQQQARRHRRFPLRYPVHIRFASRDSVSELEAESRNISMGGLLVETTVPIPSNSPVSFTMTLQGGQMIRAIELAGEGRVLRVQPAEQGSGFTIAVQCNRPLIEIAQLA